MEIKSVIHWNPISVRPEKSTIDLYAVMRDNIGGYYITTFATYNKSTDMFYSVTDEDAEQAKALNSRVVAWAYPVDEDALGKIFDENVHSK